MIDSCMEHVAADRLETFQSSPDESSSALMSNWDDVLANVHRAELCLWLYHSVITMGKVNGGLIFSLERETLGCGDFARLIVSFSEIRPAKNPSSSRH